MFYVKIGTSRIYANVEITSLKKTLFGEVELSMWILCVGIDNVDIMCWDFVSDIHESPKFLVKHY